MAIPVLGVVGWHNAGKTTFIERLVAALKERGLCVATLKHAGGHVQFDREGTDTWRFGAAGSDLVALSSPQQAALLWWPDHELSLWELVALLPIEPDILIVEGFKAEPIPRVIIVREGETGNSLEGPGECLAVVHTFAGQETEAVGAQWARGPWRDARGRLHLMADDMETMVGLLGRLGYPGA